MIEIVAAEVATSGHVDGVIFGAIAFTVFLLLGFVTWSYRDVANRHDHKNNHSEGHH
jgi:hypothetical protein